MFSVFTNPLLTALEETSAAGGACGLPPRPAAPLTAPAEAPSPSASSSHQHTAFACSSVQPFEAAAACVAGSCAAAAAALEPCGSLGSTATAAAPIPPRLAASKLHRVDAEWDPIMALGSPRGDLDVLRDQFTAMRTESSTLPRFQSAGPNYLEFPLW